MRKHKTSTKLGSWAPQGRRLGDDSLEVLVLLVALGELLRVAGNWAAVEYPQKEQGMHWGCLPRVWIGWCGCAASERLRICILRFRYIRHFVINVINNIRTRFIISFYVICAVIYCSFCCIYVWLDPGTYMIARFMSFYKPGVTFPVWNMEWSWRVTQSKLLHESLLFYLTVPPCLLWEVRHWEDREEKQCLERWMVT